jgi:Sel1 repeat
MIDQHTLQRRQELYGAARSKQFVNPSAAIALYTEAAELGEPRAQRALANVYSIGDLYGVEADASRSVLYDTFAARAGDASANLRLARRYLIGDGVPPDCQKAIPLLKSAADWALAQRQRQGVWKPQIRTRLGESEHIGKRSQADVDAELVLFYEHAATEGVTQFLLVMLAPIFSSTYCGLCLQATLAAAILKRDNLTRNSTLST